MFILICGLPRAGKTTFSKGYENIYKVVHADNYGSFKLLTKIIKGQDNIVVDGIFKTADQRKDLLRLSNSDFSKCIWLDTSKEIRKARPGYSELLNYNKFEPPTYDEGWDEIIIIKDNEEVTYVNKG